MKYLPFAFILSFLTCGIAAQETEQKTISEIYANALTDSSAYQNLRFLCKHTKGRIAGSPQAAAAVEFTYQKMLHMGLDTVYLQEVWVPAWKRGETEICQISSSKLGSENLTITALGLSEGTGKQGISAEVIEIKNFEELEKSGKSNIEGKIVFFNRPMDPELINTFAAYGGAADQRTHGAEMASRYGARAVVVRSLSSSIDDYPHTGVMYYGNAENRIPAVAVSTSGAERLSEWLKKDPDLLMYLETHSKTYPDVKSYNVIGEIRGLTEPDKIITVGGHLDAWDNSEGAHDDGAGCVQSLEVLRLFKATGISPQKTIRAVMFMDEEIAQSGGKKYAMESVRLNEKHVFALESDRGGLSPLGFGFSGEEERVKKLISLQKYFTEYNLHIFKQGGGGVDISPLKNVQEGIVLSSYIPDWQRYFDYHHSPNDSFDKINYRELQLGSAAIASLVYLVDKLDY